ncbi:unnamed protein product [Amoebophrya sp. A120]|nr:unnamed protein product [Amoebophrya sp. A120]|eukprot:GSA120T00019714001.1
MMRSSLAEPAGQQQRAGNLRPSGVGGMFGKLSTAEQPPARPVAAKTSTKPQKNWAEKHRPKKLQNIVLREQTRKTFEKSIEQPLKMPHLLMYGPPGTGKTTTAWAFLYELFGKKAAGRHVKALNSSQDRGIKVIREEVKPYCEAEINDSKDEPGYPNPRLKFILMDEADALTMEAQAALRRVIEENSDNTRFILCCNYVNKIIEPIQSRCASVAFTPLAPDLHKLHLVKICKEENVVLVEDNLEKFSQSQLPIDMEEDFDYNDCNSKIQELNFNTPCLDFLVDLSDGDCRRSITLLQSVASVCSRKGKDADSTVTVGRATNMFGGGGSNALASRASVAGAAAKDVKIRVTKPDLVQVSNSLEEPKLQEIVNHILYTETFEEVENDAEWLLRNAFAVRAVIIPIWQEIRSRAKNLFYSSAASMSQFAGSGFAGTKREDFLPLQFSNLQWTKVGILIAEVDGMVNANVPTDAVYPYFLLTLYLLLNTKQEIKPAKNLAEVDDHALIWAQYSVGVSKYHDEYNPYPKEEMWGNEIATF